MTALLAFALLAAPDAHARATPDGETNPLEVHVRGSAQFLQGYDAPATSVAVEGVARRDAYVAGEVRFAPDGSWRGRGGVGLDLLGGARFDLKIGAFLGAAGCWNNPSLAGMPLAGTDLTIGANFDRIYGRYRWSVGMGGPKMGQLVTENDMILGYRVIDELRVFGQYVGLNPGPLASSRSLGAGVEYRF